MNTVELKEGQTYICTKSDKPWWTVGKEYPVFLDSDNEPVIKDDDGDKRYSNFIRTFYNQFKLKETQVETEKHKYTGFDVTKVILRAYNMYDNDAQRLAFIKGYFAK